MYKLAPAIDRGSSSFSGGSTNSSESNRFTFKQSTPHGTAP